MPTLRTPTSQELKRLAALYHSLDARLEDFHLFEFAERARLKTVSTLGQYSDCLGEKGRGHKDAIASAYFRPPSLVSDDNGRPIWTPHIVELGIQHDIQSMLREVMDEVFEAMLDLRRERRPGRPVTTEHDRIATALSIVIGDRPTAGKIRAKLEKVCKVLDELRVRTPEPRENPDLNATAVDRASYHQWFTKTGEHKNIIRHLMQSVERTSKSD